MCSPVMCQTCGKTTWAGCGQHVDDVKQYVPREQWCDGDHAEPAAGASRSGAFRR